MKTINPQPKKSKRNTLLLLGGAGAFLVICCCLGIALRAAAPQRSAPTVAVGIIQTSIIETSIALQPPEATSLPALTLPPEPTSTPVQPQLGQTRDRPHPAGAAVDIGGDMHLSIIAVTRPADDIVERSNMFNPTPEPNLEYVIITLRVQCSKAVNDKCLFSTYELKTVGIDGNIRDQAFAAGIPQKLEPSQEFFSGAVVEGNVVFLVPRGDPTTVLMYEPLFFGEPTYLALQ